MSICAEPPAFPFDSHFVGFFSLPTIVAVINIGIRGGHRYNMR